jgi:hypothetical protein
MSQDHNEQNLKCDKDLMNMMESSFTKMEDPSTLKLEYEMEMANVIYNKNINIHLVFEESLIY